ncbi:hypothetical protein AACH10_14810 [Ideonella sp. DXS22W]|uniref:SPOR domain-containing protein n=1 Tax=Pseudaquabacterium inlustre TaxID=2984192 RepID=A0ABU9CLR8_9BURK
MLRPLLIGLLVVNGALLAARWGGAERWLSGSDGREHEPERLQRQVNPGALRVQPVPPPRPAPVGASAPVPVPDAPQGAAPPAPPSLAQASAPRTPVCVEAGPFDAATLAAAKRVLREAGVPETAWQAASAPAAPRHVILMGRYADPEHLQRKTGELRRKGVTFVELHQSPDIPARHLPGLVLGRYADARTAEAALQALRNRGVISAQLVMAEAHAPGTLLRVADPGGLDLKARTAALTLPGRQAWRPCAPAPGAAAASRA